MTFIQRLTPLNREEEKRKFFFDPLYNPQFTYNEPLKDEEFTRYGNVSSHLLSKAQTILDAVLKRYGSETLYLQEAEGEVLEKEALESIVDEYLTENDLATQVQVLYTQDAISPASMRGSTLVFRVPIAQRKKRIVGTLHHEIGTHYFRRLNDEAQPWHGKRAQFDLHPYLDTEEGLAILHSHLFLESQYLWFAALYYCAIYWSSQMSFSALYKKLHSYIDDPIRRWNITLRAKRGIQDTSIPRALAKDQVYFRGVTEVLKWLLEQDGDVKSLYYGKIAVQDVKKLPYIAPNYNPKLPNFLLSTDQKTLYRRLRELQRTNLL